MSDRPSPRPIAIAGFVIIFLTFGVLGGWASVAKLDSAIYAPGTISLEGNRKVVQHFEGGIVEEILVQEADTVEAGQVVLRLSDVEARSNLQVINTRLDVAKLVEARLLAERKLSEDFNIPVYLSADTASASLQAVIKDQLELFQQRRSILQSRADILATRMEQTRTQIDGLELQKSALEKRLTNFQEMVDRMRSGEEKGLIQTNILAQREDELIQIEASLGRIISEIAQAQNAISETELESLQVRQEYQERANNELEQIRAEISELEQRANIANDVLERTEIRAPISGTVQGLKVHTVGSVIRPGEVLMEMVPDDERLVINARVSPIDKDNVSPGLTTEIRFTAFKAKLTPIMLGEVDTVSGDVITPENPNEAPYFLARVVVNEADIPSEIAGRLTAGMPADVLVSTGERTVIDYIVSPLMDAVRKSMIEE